jgi:hypothetical protein
LAIMEVEENWLARFYSSWRLPRSSRGWFLFYGKLMALLNFGNKFNTNDGLDQIHNLINPHNAIPLHGPENVPPYYIIYFDERN